MNDKPHPPTKAWLEAAATFRKIKASQNGFADPDSRQRFISNRFDWLLERLPKTKGQRAVYKEIMRLGSIDLLDESLRLHGLDSWKKAWSTVGAGDPAGAGNIIVLRRLLEMGFDLELSAGKMLLSAAQTDNHMLLDLWLACGLGESKDAKIQLGKVIETCGPACAPRIHRLIQDRADSNSSYALGGIFIEAMRKGRPKTAAYLRASGVTFANISEVWEALAPDTDFLGIALEAHYRRFEGSAHAELAFRKLEPDPVAALGRPKHEGFAGITLEDLFEASQGPLCRAPA